MEHLALEVFDLATADNPKPTGSRYAALDPDESISITDTSEVFASGDVWSHSFTLNAYANAHILGTVSDLHGSRLHDIIHKRRARLWVEGLPLYLGYLMLDGDAEVEENGDVSVKFESGQKTFDELIEGTKAREVSVGDVVIGVALNRKRVSEAHISDYSFTLDGLEGYAVMDPRIKDVLEHTFSNNGGIQNVLTPYVQRWPKLVKSRGLVYDSQWNRAGSAVDDSGNTIVDYTNVQTPYDASHPFCNINICYPLKVDDDGEEKVTRGYTLRLAHGKDTTDGGDNQTRFNNAPNFYLLHFIDRLFKDMKIHVDENQCLAVEDLRRVFMLNYGCHYEEIEDYDSSSQEWKTSHFTPSDLVSRYGQYYFPILTVDDKESLVRGWDGAGQFCYEEPNKLDHLGKVLMRNLTIKKNGVTIPCGKTIEGFVQEVKTLTVLKKTAMYLKTDMLEVAHDSYSAYLAYATGDNYPDVEISEIIEAMKSMFGVRFLFSDDYKRVRIVLLRNIFRSSDVQEVRCEVIEDSKEENGIRGFRMTYGKGTDDTNYYYKGFNDLFPRISQTWKDTTDTHDYSQWDLNADYDKAKQSVSAFNKTCYVTPVNGNAYGVKVDEDEDVLFPSLFEMAGFMDAEDGDCSGESDTIHEIQAGASPVIMNEVGDVYASLFSGDMKAPTPEIVGSDVKEIDKSWEKVKTWIVTYGNVPLPNPWPGASFDGYTVTGDLDFYIAEGFNIRLLDNYGVSNGGTPFDDADVGLQFGIMRGSGSDAFVKEYDDPDDDENNTWDIVQGRGAVDHPDTCDSYGKVFDYTADGQDDPQDMTGRFSLKLRAEKLNPFYDPDSDDPGKQKRYLEITDERLRQRGLCDTFYKEYSYWMRNARVVKRTVRMELAQLLAIDKTKRVRVGDITGFIRKVQYTVSNKTGLGRVTMEIMYI